MAFPMRWHTSLTVLSVIVYFLVSAGLVVWLVQVRTWSIENQDNPQARAEWERWRKVAAEPATTEGSVARQVPKSAEPPLLLMMREYFVMSVAAILFFWTALFVPLVLMLRGVISQSGSASQQAGGSTKTA